MFTTVRIETRRRAGEVEMQTTSRWQSPTMPGLYARKQIARRRVVAQLQYRQ